jgi:transglutaminase-like putative cysteine protease
MLPQALPFAVLLFVFFPRLPGQFWALPSRSEATTGLSDEMSPGDVSTLSLSDALAFRVHFDGDAPPPEQRYWRAIVMSQFDGRTWRANRDISTILQPGHITATGTVYSYRLALEPTQQRWLPALDMPVTWPTGWPVPRSLMTVDMVLVSPQPVTSLATLQLQSASSYTADAKLPRFARQVNTALPKGRNPRTQELATQLRSEVDSDSAYVQRVLQKFRQEKFYYTLEPPTLGVEAIDDFLLNTRSGFCEHFASAFTVMMRAVGIPSRVVTGYQGGEFNSMGEYYILRQSDAHAWSEVWLEGSGWVRVDPTAAIAPQRIERGMDAALGADEPVPGRMLRRLSILNQLRLSWDAVNAFWNDHIVAFNIDEQREIFRWFGLTDLHASTYAKAILFAFIGFASLLAAWLAWKYKPVPRDPAATAYEALKRKLAKHQLRCEPHEGPIDFLTRAAASHAQSELLNELRDLYVAMRYGPRPNVQMLSRLRYLVNQVR